MLDSAIQGQRIAALRNRLMRGQRAFAADAGIPQTTLSRIENGVRAARMDELVKIAWALGCPIASLVESEPLGDRVVVATRANRPHADAHEVRERLIGFLAMDALLDANGVSQP